MQTTELSITVALPVCLKNGLLCIYFVMPCYVSGLPYICIKHMMTSGMATAVDQFTTLIFVQGDRYKQTTETSIQLLVSTRIYISF